MSIASKLTQLETDITNAYDAVDDMGGTIPVNKNTNNLNTAIRTIPSGAKPEETKTVALDMSSGDQIITPTTGSVLTQVTIEKPSTLLPANIKKDENIGGVIGSLEAEPTDIVADYSVVTSTLGANALRTDQQWYARGVTRINLPNVTTIGNYFCYTNVTIKKVEIPSVTSLGQQAFQNASSLEYLDASSLTVIPNSFVNGARSLTTLILPWKQVTSIGTSAFPSVPYQYYNLPLVTTLGTSAFNYQSTNTYYNFPLLETLSGDTWHKTTAGGGPVALYFPSLTAINSNYNFYYCDDMVALILGTSNCTLGAINSFQINSTKIYVPSADLATYKSATNWATYASRIFGVYENADKALNETFTPTVSDPDIASNIVSWDYIPVNKATATVNSSTGETTITGVGCFPGTNKSSQILLRGLDSSDNPIYNCLINITQTEV